MAHPMKQGPSFVINPKWSVLGSSEKGQIVIINHENGGSTLKLDVEEAHIFDQLFLECESLHTGKVQALVDKLIKKDVLWLIPKDYWEADFLDRQCRVSEEMIVSYVSPFTVNIQSVHKTIFKYQATDMLHEVFKDFEQSSLSIREIILNHSEQFIEEDKELVRKYLYRFTTVLLKEKVIVLC